MGMPTMDVFVFAAVVDTLIAHMSFTARSTLLAAGLLGFSGVALGAFGAHALKETLATLGTSATWQTAVHYQLIHAVALLALAGWPAGGAGSVWIMRCWIAGVVLFSGSLYWLALGGPRILGPVTPLGGATLLLGWALLAWNAWSQPRG
jgi:uncharacterized membrane protein YgdD (TMEM256/DUF423 family)